MKLSLDICSQNMYNIGIFNEKGTLNYRLHFTRREERTCARHQSGTQEVRYEEIGRASCRERV